MDGSFLVAKILKALGLVLGLASSAMASAYQSLYISTNTGQATMNLSGNICLAASSTTPNTCNITMYSSTAAISGNPLTVAANGSSVFISTIGVNPGGGVVPVLGITQGNHMQWQGNATAGGNSTNNYDLDMFYGDEGRLEYQCRGQLQICAIDIYPTTTSVFPTNEGVAELTIHGFSSIMGNGTSYEQNSFGKLPDALGGFYYDSMESGSTSTGTLRDFQWRHETGTGETWNGVNGPIPGQEVYLIFAATRTYNSVPIDFLYSHILFGRSNQRDISNSDFIGTSTGPAGGILFNTQAFSSMTFTVNDSTVASITPNGFVVTSPGSIFTNLFQGLSPPALISVSSDSTTNYWGAFTQAPLALQNPSATNNNWNQMVFIDGQNNGGGVNIVGSIGMQETSHSSPTGDMVFGVANPSITEKMRLKATGNLGIGTSSPSTTLDVAGNAQFGSGVSKSTFSTTGSLTIATGATLTATTNNLTFGVYIATTTAGAAGVGVTAPCSNGSATAKAIGGGCSCSGGVALTSTINRPDVSGSAPSAGTTMPTGWFCQDAGGTGGACAAFAICTNILQ